MDDVLTRLADTLQQRKAVESDSSYVASLYAKGLDKILEKVGEEAVETILAAKNAAQSGDTEQLVSETADLWFHTLIMLAHLQQRPEAILAELERREGRSGLEEKAARKRNQRES